MKKGKLVIFGLGLIAGGFVGFGICKMLGAAQKIKNDASMQQQSLSEDSNQDENAPEGSLEGGEEEKGKEKEE